MRRPAQRWATARIRSATCASGIAPHTRTRSLVGRAFATSSTASTVSPARPAAPRPRWTVGRRRGRRCRRDRGGLGKRHVPARAARGSRHPGDRTRRSSPGPRQARARRAQPGPHVAVPGARGLPRSSHPTTTHDADGDLAMRIIEAQEAERARLAHEIHDGPAQALSRRPSSRPTTLERVSATDPAATTKEIGVLRDLLRRELDSLRGFISQLRPPLLERLGLDGAIEDAVADVRAATDLQLTTDLRAPNRRARRPSADRGPARDAGGTAECAQARRRLDRRGQHGRGGRCLDPRDPRRWSWIRCRCGGRAWPSELRIAIHARASGADRCALRRTISSGRRYRGPTRDPEGRPDGR